MTQNMPTITLTSVQIPYFHLATTTKGYASMADNLNDLSIAPAIGRANEDVVSLEVMLHNGKVEYDFAVIEKP